MSSPTTGELTDNVAHEPHTQLQGVTDIGNGAVMAVTHEGSMLEASSGQLQVFPASEIAASHATSGGEHNGVVAEQVTDGVPQPPAHQATNGQRATDASHTQTMEANPIVDAAMRRRAARIMALYTSVRRAGEVPLPENAIHHMLRHFPDWEYHRDEESLLVHYLTRRVMDASIALKLRQPETPTRSIHRDEDTITVRVRDQSVRNKDIQTLLQIEGQYPERLARLEIEARQNGTPVPNAALNEFRGSQGIYVHEDDILTDTETVILSCTADYGSPQKLAESLETTSEKLNRLLRPVRERLGIKATPGKADAYIELTLVALALELANTDHVPKPLQSELDRLSPYDREVMEGYYSFDREKRETLHARRSESSLSQTWSKLYNKINVKGKEGRHSAVLYAVKSRILELPDPAIIRAMLARDTTTPS